MRRLRILLMAGTTATLLLAGITVRAANAPPLWILQQNRRAAEEYQRSQAKGVTVAVQAGTPTLAVPTPARLDP